MPFVIVYSPSDFITPPPAEAGAMASGNGPFTLTLAPGATGTVIEVADADAIFDEVDSTQALATDAILDGTTFPASTTINTAYDLINSATGHKVTSLHFGGTGYQQGAVDGIVSTLPLEPGTSYTFDLERTSHRQDNRYDDYVACFVEGTEIMTQAGPRAIETLRPGTLVMTEDCDLQPVRWIGSKTVPGDDVFAPVRIRAGHLGLSRDLFVSPAHRVQVKSGDVELMFGTVSVLVAARHLCDGHIAQRAPRPEVTYWHFLLDAHHVVFAHGAAVETMMPDINTLCDLDPEGWAELATFFPDLVRSPNTYGPTARVCLRHHEAALLIAA